MGLEIVATRQIQIIKTSAYETQFEYFASWDVPRGILNTILNSENPALEYTNWILSETGIEQIPVYFDGDYFQQGPIDYYKEVHVGEEHIEDLVDWIRCYENRGYDIEYLEN
jgi:ABC-type polysaccharide transport system permease subunit